VILKILPVIVICDLIFVAAVVLISLGSKAIVVFNSSVLSFVISSPGSFASGLVLIRPEVEGLN
jgi:hypothetical protein